MIFDTLCVSELSLYVKDDEANDSDFIAEKSLRLNSGCELRSLCVRRRSWLDVGAFKHSWYFHMFLCKDLFDQDVSHIFYAKMHRQDGTSNLFPAVECEMTSSCLDMLGAWSDRPRTLVDVLRGFMCHFSWQTQNFCDVGVPALSRTTSGRWRCFAQQHWSLC